MPSSDRDTSRSDSAAIPEASRTRASGRAERPAFRRVLSSRRGHSRLSVEAVITALRATGGLRAAAADRLGVGRSTLWEFMKAHPEIEAALVEIEETMADFAEAKLFEAIGRGDVTAIIFYLSRRAKDRGYSKRVEVVGPADGPIRVAAPPSTEEMMALLERLAAERRARERTSP